MRRVALQFVYAFAVAVLVLTCAFTLLPAGLLRYAEPRVLLVLIFAYGIGVAWAFVYYVWQTRRR